MAAPLPHAGVTLLEPVPDAPPAPGIAPPGPMPICCAILAICFICSGSMPAIIFPAILTCSGSIPPS